MTMPDEILVSVDPDRRNFEYYAVPNEDQYNYGGQTKYIRADIVNDPVSKAVKSGYMIAIQKRQYDLLLSMAKNTRAQPPSADCVIKELQRISDDAAHCPSFRRGIDCALSLLTVAPQNTPEGTLDRGPCSEIKGSSACTNGKRFTYGVDSYTYDCPDCQTIANTQPTFDKNVSYEMDIEKLRAALKHNACYSRVRSFSPQRDDQICLDQMTIENAARAHLEMMEKTSDR